MGSSFQRPRTTPPRTRSNTRGESRFRRRERPSPLRSGKRCMRARLGADVVPGAHAAFVGREREVTLLHETLARVSEERSAQLVTLVGVPGIGKSRLVNELKQLAAASGNQITWRQGRSLPYGDGVAFWALGEMAK